MTTASQHADLLNALHEMQQSLAYAVRRHVLADAERVIVEQEQRIARLEAECDRIARQCDEMTTTLFTSRKDGPTL